MRAETRTRAVPVQNCRSETRTRLVEVTKTRIETRTRPVKKLDPETGKMEVVQKLNSDTGKMEDVTTSYQVLVPYTEMVKQNYTVDVPYTKTITQTYTVSVPYTENVEEFFYEYEDTDLYTLVKNMLDKRQYTLHELTTEVTKAVKPNQQYQFENLKRRLYLIVDRGSPSDKVTLKSDPITFSLSGKYLYAAARPATAPNTTHADSRGSADEETIDRPSNEVGASSQDKTMDNQDGERDDGENETDDTSPFDEPIKAQDDGENKTEDVSPFD